MTLTLVGIVPYQAEDFLYAMNDYTLAHLGSLSSQI